MKGKNNKKAKDRSNKKIRSLHPVFIIKDENSTQAIKIIKEQKPINRLISGNTRRNKEYKDLLQRKGLSKK